MAQNSWTKEDLRAVIELGTVAAGVGALAGWISGYGAVVGTVIAIALLALILGIGCFIEAIWPLK